ncbi:MAG: DUF1254 domain-containing protein, partial [Bacteroidota bacterium]
VDKSSPGYRAPFNEFYHISQLLDADFTEVVTPNNDTFYDFLWLDLRSEPIVVSVPEIPRERYYAFQLVDMYTHNFGYIGSRATGSSAGKYLIAGPDWRGEKPAGIKGVFQSEGQIVFALGRTQVNGEDDGPAVKEIQAQFTATPLSKYLEQSATSPTPALDFPPYDEKKASSADFIGYLNFLLSQLKPDTSEKEMLARFEKIGIEAGEDFDAEDLDSALREAIEDGVASALKKIKGNIPKMGEVKNGWVMSVGVFGNRKEMRGKYLTRASAAMIGLYGNTHYEAFYPMCSVDEKGEQLDGSKNSYVMHFTKENIPAVRAFWSTSLYWLPEKLFVPNRIDRYSIGDRTPGLRFGRDGSLRVYIQKNAPSGSRRANWLPAPDGPFYLICRLYWPKDKVFLEDCTPPTVRKVR